MWTSFITARLATVTTLIFAGTLTLASAASGADNLSGLASRALIRLSRYYCTATFEQYAPQTYCAEMREYPPFDDGFFTLTMDQTSVHGCSYEAEGTPPNAEFGVSTDFFCHGLNTGMAQVGRIVGNTIKGQTYGLNVVGGVRSVFTCERVATCP